MEQYFENYARFEQQRWMVADKPRTDAFAKAIKEIVRPGDVVIDLGAGSGLLSILAAQAGAKKVIAIERSNMARHAKALIKANGFENIIEVFHGNAEDLALTEKADVLISEWLGHLAYVEGMFPAVVAVRDRFLKPNGKMIPDSVDLLLAPIEDLELYHDYGPGFWLQKIHNIDFSGFAKKELDRGHTNQLKINPKFLISKGQVFHKLDANKAIEKDQWGSKSLDYQIERNCKLTGFVGWFTLGLSPETTLDTAPDAPTTHWVQTYFPFPETSLKEGEKLEVQVYSDEAFEGKRLMELIIRVNEREVRYVID